MTQGEMETEVAALQQRAAIEWHLTGNFMPPIGYGDERALAAAVDLAVQAVEACNAGEDERVLALPTGMEFGSRRTEVQAGELVEAWRLDDLVSVDDEGLPIEGTGASL